MSIISTTNEELYKNRKEILAEKPERIIITDEGIVDLTQDLWPEVIVEFANASEVNTYWHSNKIGQIIANKADKLEIRLHGVTYIEAENATKVTAVSCGKLTYIKGKKITSLTALDTGLKNFDAEKLDVFFADESALAKGEGDYDSLEKRGLRILYSGRQQGYGGLAHNQRAFATDSIAILYDVNCGDYLYRGIRAA